MINDNYLIYNIPTYLYETNLETPRQTNVINTKVSFDQLYRYQITLIIIEKFYLKMFVENSFLIGDSKLLS